MSDIVLHVSLQHHEKVDGSGYPGKLTNEQIDLYAKLSAVCDVYDAITSIRAYKNSWEPALSVRKMAEWSHGHFDQRIYEALYAALASTRSVPSSGWHPTDWVWSSGNPNNRCLPQNKSVFFHH